MDFTSCQMSPEIENKKELFLAIILQHFVCSICRKTFKCSTALRAHKYTHTKEYNLPCSTCVKLFRYSRDLLNHELTHTGSPVTHSMALFINVLYASLLNLSVMPQTTYVIYCNTTECTFCSVVDAKPQKCSTCGKAFRTQSQVLRHVKQQHGTNIIYYCGLCSYSVIQKCNLKIHMKRHTG